MSLDALYASAPLLDEEDLGNEQTPADEELIAASGVMTLAPEEFDAVVLEALVHP